MPASGLLQFAGHKYLNLETFRKNGQGVRTPVWFAASGPVGPDHPKTFLYVYSMADSGKAKRIRNNPRVRIAPSDMKGNVTGDWIDAEARIVDDEQEAEPRSAITGCEIPSLEANLEFLQLDPRKTSCRDRTAAALT